MRKSSKILLGSVCLIAMAMGMTSCFGTQSLYAWDKYEDASYAYTKEPNEKNQTARWCHPDSTPRKPICC